MRLTSLNFVSTAAPLSKFNMLILGLGLLALAGSSVRLVLQQDSTSAVEKQIQRARPKAAVVPTRSVAQQREIDLQVKAVSSAVRQLNLPIGELLKTLRPPKDISVGLLGIDVGSNPGSENSTGSKAAGTLKITAETKTHQAMTMYVAFLAERPLFKSVYLIKHEINNDAPERPYRFLLEAQWKE